MSEPNPPAPPRTPWLDARRMRLYPRAILAAIALGFALAVGAGSGARALRGRLGGDFPAFYAAGRLLAQGQAGRLYDWHAQAAAQADLFPNAPGTRFLAFAYPPYVALPYRLLAALPYRAAYVLHTLAMTAALAALAWSIGGLLPRVRRYAFEGFCLSVAFLPMFIALYGAQSTPLLAAALGLALLACARGQDLLAGACLGALWMKPQYALPFIALFALARPRSLAPALALGALAYATGAWLCGARWPLDYLQQLPRFHRLDQQVNAGHSIGWLGVSEALLGAGNELALAAGAVLSAGCVLVLIRTWRRTRVLELRIAASIPLVLLLEPHAMYYDAGLLVPSFAIVAGRLGRAAILPLGALFLLGLGAPFGESIGVNPAFVVTLGAALLCVRVAQNSASAGM